MMPTNKPRVTFTVSTDMLDAIDAYRYGHRMKNQSQAILSLIDKGLDALADAKAPIKKSSTDLSEEAQKLATDYDVHLDTWGQKAVRGLTDTEMARTAAGRAEQAPTPEPPETPAKAVTALPRAKRRSDGFAEIKVYEQPAAAGLGNYLDEPPFHMEQYPADVIPEKTDFGVVIAGDSMEPELHNGGTVFVQSAPSIEPGQIGIFILDGKAYCKMLSVDHSRRQVQLLSVNPAYAPIPVGPNADFYTLGRVLGQWTPGIDRCEP